MCSKTAGGFIFASPPSAGPAVTPQILTRALPRLHPFSRSTRRRKPRPSACPTSCFVLAASNSWFTSSKPPFFPPAAQTCRRSLSPPWLLSFSPPTFFSGRSLPPIARFRSSADISFDFTAFKASPFRKQIFANTEKFAFISPFVVVFDAVLFPSPRLHHYSRRCSRSNSFEL